MYVCMRERERERERERDPFTRCPVLSEKECLSCVIDTRNVCLIKPKWQVSIGSVYLASNHPNNNWEQQSSKSNRPSYFHGSQWWKTRVCPPNECQINREWKTGGFSLQQGESDTEMSSSHGGLCWCPVTEHVNSSGLFMKFHLHHHDCGSDCCIPTRHPFWILKRFLKNNITSKQGRFIRYSKSSFVEARNSCNICYVHNAIILYCLCLGL